MFFRVYDKNNVTVLVDLIDRDIRDVYVDESLEKGYKTLSFMIKASRADKLEEEQVIMTEDYRYVITELNKENNDYYYVFCDPDLETLKAAPRLNFASLTQTAFNTIAMAIIGCHWDVIDKSTSKIKRTVRADNDTAYGICETVRTVFNVELEYDTVRKEVIIYDKRGEDKGFFITNEHDMSDFQLQSSTHDFYTMIYPYGKDGLTIESVNDGLKYLEDYSYCTRQKAIVWIDQRYTIPENLRDDAREKLAEMARPRRSYSCKMASLEKKGLKLGDSITFLDTNKKIKEKQRITSIKWTPLRPEDTTISLSNVNISFTEKQARLEKAAQLIENNTDDAGSVIAQIEWTGDLPANGKFTNITADTANIINGQISELDSTQATIGDLTANKAEIGEAHITKAIIDNFDLGDAILEHLNATQIDVDKINFKEAVGGVIQVDSITNVGQYVGYLTAENFEAGAITSDKLTVEDGFITNAMIADATITSAKILELDAVKITAGTIDTNRLLITDEFGNSIVFAINSANGTPQLSHTTIDGGSLTDRTITADKILANSITSNEIAANTIKGSNIEANTITSDNLAAGSITADKIAADALTVGNMAPDMQHFIENAGKGYVDEQFEKFRTEQSQYLGFSPATGLIVGSQGTGMQTQYTDSAILFFDNGNEVASISNEQLVIDKAKVKTSLKIGHYRFVPRVSGNLSLIWEDEE